MRKSELRPFLKSHDRRIPRGPRAIYNVREFPTGPSESGKMSIAIRTDPVPLKMDEDGAIRVGGTRMTLDLIIAEHQAGASPEQIAAEYDTLSLPAYGRNRAGPNRAKKPAQT